MKLGRQIFKLIVLAAVVMGFVHACELDKDKDNKEEEKSKLAVNNNSCFYLYI